MFNNPVYKCELLSITPDIRVNVDKSMRNNVLNADTEVVSTVLVKKTWNPDYFREIVTNKLIPVYCVITFDNNTVLNGTTERSAPKSPVFVKCHLKVGDEGLVLESDLIPATAEEVKTYVFDHMDREKYGEKLDSIFNQGMTYYNDSKAKGIESDEKQIKKYLKALKITKKI